MACLTFVADGVCVCVCVFVMLDQIFGLVEAVLQVRAVAPTTHDKFFFVFFQERV